MMPLFDSHCHLDDEAFDADRQTLIAELTSGMAGLVTVGSDLSSSRACHDLAKAHENIFAAAGIHPHEAAKAEPGDLDEIKGMLALPKVVALGEIGLDYHYDFSPRDVQMDLLVAQLDIAQALDKPVVLHVREAQGDMLKLLRERPQQPAGVLHCFSGSAESALEYVRMGHYISFSGSLTFKNADKLRRAAAVVPLDRLLIETDSPYLAPVPLRGKRNRPDYVVHVCRMLADIRGLTIEEMARMTHDNARRFFRLPGV